MPSALPLALDLVDLERALGHLADQPLAERLRGLRALAQTASTLDDTGASHEETLDPETLETCRAVLDAFRAGPLPISEALAAELGWDPEALLTRERVESLAEAAAQARKRADTAQQELAGAAAEQERLRALRAAALLVEDTLAALHEARPGAARRLAQPPASEQRHGNTKQQETP